MQPARRLLDEWVIDLHRSGFVGEERAAKLVYLSVTSRLGEAIVSCVVKGTSAAGKSELVRSVLRFFPDDAVIVMSSMSERAFVYDDRDVRHRMVVIYEAAGLASDLASYLMRSLLSEGRIDYTTVEKTKDGLRPRHIVREGPTGLILTTTQIKLHPENETRLLSITVSDSAAQTTRVLAAHAAERDESPAFGPWVALQERLRLLEVAIPFGPTLAELIPPVAVRLRRDFSAVLSLIRAHALLHQDHRQRDDRGRVVATIADDYAVVYDLVGDLIADAAERTVPETIRDTVRAADELGAGSATVGVISIATHLKLDKSTASRRVKAAIERGFLRNLEERRYQPAKIVLGEPMPDDKPILPSPDRLRGCMESAGDTHEVVSPRSSVGANDPSPTPSERLEETLSMPTLDIAIEDDYPASAWLIQ